VIAASENFPRGLSLLKGLFSCAEKVNTSFKKVRKMKKISFIVFVISLSDEDEKRNLVKCFSATKIIFFLHPDYQY